MGQHPGRTDPQRARAGGPRHARRRRHRDAPSTGNSIEIFISSEARMRMNRFGLRCSSAAIVLGMLAFGSAAQAAVVVDDSWADAGRNNGADTLDTDWWTSTTSSAIEVSAGSLGLVSGTSGRGIHG